MVKKDKQITGKKGEDLASLFLEKQGFEIIDRNYWQKWGEIDIVANRDAIIHFVEVKTVSRDKLLGEGSDDYEPEDNLHLWKRQRLSRVIQTYLLSKKIDDSMEWQIDIVSVYLDKNGNQLKIDYLPDIIL
ncbi:MAG: YraN family protein [Patescibacteria group bacterium]